MKALEILKKLVDKKTGYTTQKEKDEAMLFYREAIKELEDLQNRSCDGCIHKNSEGVMEYSCFECSRYYADKFEKKDKQ